MEQLCQNCGSPNIKHVPAGFSQKKQKPYKAFDVCEDCKAFQNNGQKPQNAPSSQKPVSSSNAEVLDALRKLYALTQDNNRGIATILERLEPKDEFPEPRF